MVSGVSAWRDCSRACLSQLADVGAWHELIGACLCRKALHLLRHVIQAHPQDAATACQLGAAQQAASCLASTDDDTWQAAILLIQQLAQDTETLQQLKQVRQLVTPTGQHLLIGKFCNRDRRGLHICQALHMTWYCRGTACCHSDSLNPVILNFCHPAGAHRPSIFALAVSSFCSSSVSHVTKKWRQVQRICAVSDMALLLHAGTVQHSSPSLLRYASLFVHVHSCDVCHCTMQDSHLQHQLQDLESRLQVLTGENRAAVEEELGHCSQLLGILHGQAAPSEPQSDTQSASSGSARQDVQRQSQPAAGSRNQTTAPLLLGPPS